MDPNNPLQSSFLGSKWLNPDYLFNQAIAFFQQIFDFFSGNGAQMISVLNTILFILALFFLAIISYTSIRIFEIRSKENFFLKHEIAESAHHQAEREKKISQGE